MSVLTDQLNATIAQYSSKNPTEDAYIKDILNVLRIVLSVETGEGTDISGIVAQLLLINPTTTVLAADTVQEQTSGHGVLVSSLLARNGFFVAKPTPTAKNTTATLTAAELLTGVITSTSVATVSLTLPSAASMVAILGNGRGSYFDFVVDNTVGANTVTLVLPASITQLVVVPNGGSGALTIAASATLGVGIFRIYFYSATAAVISRIG